MVHKVVNLLESRFVLELEIMSKSTNMEGAVVASKR